MGVADGGLLGDGVGCIPDVYWTRLRPRADVYPMCTGDVPAVYPMCTRYVPDAYRRRPRYPPDRLPTRPGVTPVT